METTSTLKKNHFAFYLLALLLFVTTPTLVANAEVVDVKIVAPTALSAINVSATSFTARWTSVSGATSYRVLVFFRISIMGGYAYIPQSDYTTANTLHTFTGLTNNQYYRYSVTAFLLTSESVASNTIDVHTEQSAPDPTAASGITHYSFVANWAAAAGATSYKINVVDEETQAFVKNGMVVNGTSITISGLKPNHSYRYAVLSVNGTVESALSSWITGITTLNLPAPDPAQASNVTMTSFTANWASVVGATGYKLFVSEKVKIGTVYMYVYLAGYNGKSVTGTSSQVSGLDAGRDYSYAISTVQNTTESVKSTSTAVNTKTVAPVASAVSNLTASTATTSWSTVPGASSYKLFVYSKISINGIPFPLYVNGYNGKEVSDTSEVVSGLNMNSPFFYDVLALNGETESAYSNEIAFRTKVTEPIASAASKVMSTSFSANWNAVSGIEEFELFVYKQAEFGRTWTVVTGYNGKQVTGTSAAVTGLTSNADYKFYLKSVSGAYKSDASNEIFVTTAKTVGVDDLSTERTLKIYPCPASQFIQVSGLNKGEVVEIISVSGKKMNSFKAANSIENIDIRSLYSGIYFMRVESNSGTSKLKFIKD